MVQWFPKTVSESVEKYRCPGPAPYTEFECLALEMNPVNLLGLYEMQAGL